MARMSKIIYTVSKEFKPNKMKLLHFKILTRYVQKTLRPDKTIAGRQSTHYRSANSFDDPEIHVKDGAFLTNNRESLNHDPCPRPDLARGVPV